MATTLRTADWYTLETEPDAGPPAHATRCDTHGCWHRAPICPKCADDERERLSNLEAARIRERMRREVGQVVLCRNRLHLVSVGENCLECYRTRMARVRAAKALGVPAPKRTHCDQGHEFTAENTYTSPGTGWRSCRACTKVRDQARYARILREKATGADVTPGGVSVRKLATRGTSAKASAETLTETVADGSSMACEVVGGGARMRSRRTCS